MVSALKNPCITGVSKALFVTPRLNFLPIFSCSGGGVPPSAFLLTAIGAVRLPAGGDKAAAAKLALLQRRFAAVCKDGGKLGAEWQYGISEILAQRTVGIGDAKHIAAAIKGQALLVMAVVIGAHRCHKAANIPQF